jgi:hypothetical protein
MRRVHTSGQVRVLDETYANCVDQTSTRLFYGIGAAENKAVFNLVWSYGIKAVDGHKKAW